MGPSNSSYLSKTAIFHLVDGRNPAKPVEVVVYPMTFTGFIHHRQLFGSSSINNMYAMYLSNADMKWAFDRYT